MKRRIQVVKRRVGRRKSGEVSSFKWAEVPNRRDFDVSYKAVWLGNPKPMFLNIFDLNPFYLKNPSRGNLPTSQFPDLTSVTVLVTYGKVIRSFKHKGLEEFFYTGSKKGIKAEHADRLGRILDRLHAAGELKDMRYPGSHMHKLTGDKKGKYAVRVSGNWRLVFEFHGGDAYAVDYEDYH